MLVFDVNVAKTFENLDSWRDEFLIQAWAATLTLALALALALALTLTLTPTPTLTLTR